MFSGSKCLLVLVLVSILLTNVMIVLGETKWIKYSSNPILSPGSWDPGGVATPRVLFDGTTFRMWYNGVDSQGNFVGIGYATSKDGKKWVANAQPVLAANPKGWDSVGISVSSVLWNGTGFLMWYRGPGTGKGAIGLATSQDGTTWVKYPANPVVIPSSIDSSHVSGPTVIQTDIGFKMWYSCKNPSFSHMSICYATSNDGKTWNKYSSPVFTQNTGELYSPSVIYDGTIYGMWYTRYANVTYETYEIDYATSKDGIAWTKVPNNPILSTGASGTWDKSGAENACVVQYMEGFLMFYDGGWKVSYAWPYAYIGMAQSPANFTLPEITTPHCIIFLILTVSLLVYRRRLAQTHG